MNKLLFLISSILYASLSFSKPPEKLTSAGLLFNVRQDRSIQPQKNLRSSAGILFETTPQSPQSDQLFISSSTISLSTETTADSQEQISFFSKASTFLAKAHYPAIGIGITAGLLSHNEILPKPANPAPLLALGGIGLLASGINYEKEQAEGTLNPHHENLKIVGSIAMVQAGLTTCALLAPKENPYYKDRVTTSVFSALWSLALAYKILTSEKQFEK